MYIDYMYLLEPELEYWFDSSLAGGAHVHQQVPAAAATTTIRVVLGTVCPISRAHFCIVTRQIKRLFKHAVETELRIRVNFERNLSLDDQTGSGSVHIWKAGPDLT